MQNPIEAADGTDYEYTKHDRNWRARVRVHTELETHAPVNGEPEVEASGIGFIISVALLDENGDVALAPDGKLRIFPAATLTLQAEALGLVDVEEEIEKAVQKQIDDAQRQLKGKDQLHAAMARFKKEA